MMICACQPVVLDRMREATDGGDHEKNREALGAVSTCRAELAEHHRQVSLIVRRKANHSGLCQETACLIETVQIGRASAATLTIMVSRANRELNLNVDPANVIELARPVAAELGWILTTPEPGHLVVSEDPTRLHCHCSPLKAKLEFSSSDDGRTRLTVEGEVPGWGPIASRHVVQQTDLLTRRIGLAAIRAESPLPDEHQRQVSHRLA